MNSGLPEPWRPERRKRAVRGAGDRIFVDAGTRAKNLETKSKPGVDARLVTMTPRTGSRRSIA